MPEKEFLPKFEGEEKESPGKEETKEIQKKILEFFEQEEDFLSGYAQEAGLRFKIGPECAFDPDKGEVMLSSQWFTEQGFNPPQAMVQALHEIEHFGDLRENPEEFRQIYGRRALLKKRRFRLLYNCLDDISVNNKIKVRAPVYQKTIEEIYQTKAFPKTDFRKIPRHLQFAYTLMREEMLPQEECQVDSLVREKIKELRNFKGQFNLIELLSVPGVKLKTRYQIIRRYIEPIYEELFQKDLEEKKKRDKEGKEAKGKRRGKEKVKGKKRPKTAKPEKEEIGEEVFSDYYDEYDQHFPQPISPEELKKAAQRIEEKLKEEEAKTQAGPAELNKTAYEKEHGVTFEDIQQYQREYEHIEPYIKELKEIFEKIIASRKQVRRRLKALKKEGAIIEPGLLVQAYIDAKKDVFGAKVWRQYEKREIETYGPNEFEVTLVCDLSGSMESPRTKLIEQRRCALLLMEVLKDFSSALDKEREELALDLNVKSEVRGFTEVDIELKSLSPDLDEKTRIEVYKNLDRAPGASTNDFKSLREIRQNLSEEDEKKLLDKSLRKVVIVFSDGASSNERAVQQELKALRELGITVVGVGMTKAAELIKQTYRPNAQICYDVSKLPETLKELLKDFFEEL